MVRVRIAPSPTGKDLHVGSVATALMNFAWAKRNKGQFIVRIEDTDRSRLVEGGEEKMLESLESLGLVPDESPKTGGPFAPYRQSQRLSLYQKYAAELVAAGKAYYCTCTPERLDAMRKEQQAAKQSPKYDRQCYRNQEEVARRVKEGASHVVRLLMPERTVTFTDLIRGEISINTASLDDQVILKSDGFPTYHLGVVVDDHLMEITHVIRGEEWLPSTPKHIILFEAFGWKAPEFAHVSVLRNPDKSKLSKRKNPVWTGDYLSKGILPAALLNYLALMGWSHPEGKELFDLEEYVRVFDIKDVQTTAPVFDPVKLEWMNGSYIRMTADDKLHSLIMDFYRNELPGDTVRKTVSLVKERMKKLSDYLPLTEFLFKDPESYDIDLSKYKPALQSIRTELAGIGEWNAVSIGERMAELAKKLGMKNSEFFMVLRVAVTGKKITPPLNESMELLGRDATLKRIENAANTQ